MTSALRYGLIGTGMMGLEHQRNLNALAGAEVVAAADPHGPSLEAAQFTAANPGQVCPAKWNEGAKTLTPSLDLVGKI